METELVFCENCGSDVAFVEEAAELHDEYNNVPVTFAGKRARCVTCKHIVVPRSVYDYNHRMMIAEYKRRTSGMEASE